MTVRSCYHCGTPVPDGVSHDCWTTTEATLTRDLSEDLRDAWERLRDTAAGFGDQRIYASHQSIMFSRQACYFFVRPKARLLELCVFLGRTVTAPQVRRTAPASRVKIGHIIHVRHRDEVESPLTDWLREAYEMSDSLRAPAKVRTAGSAEGAVSAPGGRRPVANCAGGEEGGSVPEGRGSRRRAGGCRQPPGDAAGERVRPERFGGPPSDGRCARPRGETAGIDVSASRRCIAACDGDDAILPHGRGPRRAEACRQETVITMPRITPNERRIRHFRNAAAFERWLAAHHDREPEVWVRIFKKASGVATVTPDQALEIVLCWGWIDGLRKRFDEDSFLQRYTPRRPKSLWSQVNRDHATRLIAAGRMQPPGLRQVDAARADGRWDAAYAPIRAVTEAVLPEDLRTAIEASPRARVTLQSLGRLNLFALALRTNAMRTPAGRARTVAALVAMLERGETLVPERGRQKRAPARRRSS